MKKPQRSTFKLSPIAAAIVIAMASQYPMNMAYAGSGWGDGLDISNAPRKIPTYYANSPAGKVPALGAATVGIPAMPNPTAGQTTLDPVTKLPITVDTGKALRKFVDTLPGIGAAKANNLGQYLPQAKAEKWVDLNGNATGDDYYEIAAVEYTEKMHSDLPKATKLRGYVQLETPGNAATSKHIALTYPDGTPIVKTVVVNGVATQVPVLAYDKPHHLGPIIQTKRGTAVRVKFTNYLPVGGELFIPVDTTITGAGVGPDGVTKYTQNRAEIHLVGGDAPWISAGTPHQWVAPAGEVAAYAAGLGKGKSNQDVPDMDIPGDGSTTLYFPNDLSARFMFYQDRTSGLTRLNSYAGLEAGYKITDDAEASLIASGAVPADEIPLIIEDKTFVPQNIAQQDAKWDTVAWGQPGDLWFPHVYEINQDPTSALGTNPVGRWDYGPLFWPIFAAPDALPTGEHGNASFTPDALFDTPLVNGTAYPTLTVSPKAYRFRVVNASNDRYLNLGLYKADTAAGIAPQLDANGNPIYNAAGVQQFFTGTEVKMVPALADTAGNPAVPVSSNVPYDPNCLCQYPSLLQNVNAAASGPVRAWPTDARRGGTPDPTSVGPDMIAIGNDGGLLPNPVDIPSQPATYEANRRSITVGNLYGYGLLLGPAERGDVIVDFSQYAGQTLIVFNDGPAPNPWGDERNDYYSNSPDLTGIGGSYGTKPGYGPNTRTIMQIKVAAATPAAPAAAPYNPALLKTALPAAYAASQPQPIVPAVAYNNAFGTNDPDIYAHVASGSLAQPTLDFASSGALKITGITLGSSGGAGNGSGTGYDPLNPPVVTFNNVVNGTNCLGAGGISAEATATVDPVTKQVSAVNFKIDPVTGLAMMGSGYTCAPTVTFATTPNLTGVTIANGGRGYNPAMPPAVTITGAGVGASATAVVNPLTGAITGVTNFVAGSGYTSAPTVAFAAGVVLTGVSVDLNGGGAGYDPLNPPTVNFVGGGGTGASATAVVDAAGAIIGLVNFVAGSGYTSAPAVTFTDSPLAATPATIVATATVATVDGTATGGVTMTAASGIGAQAFVQTTNAMSYPVYTKAEQELFDNTGRYNSTGGVELPFTNAVTQTTIPLNYIDAPTEVIKDGEVQLWKIVDNGFWTNSMHFDFVDVQLVNRVGWDGTVKPPSSNEVGWKDTLHLHQLEDMIVAMKAKRPAVPFGLPQSNRSRDPSKALNVKGSGLGFTVDPGVVAPGVGGKRLLTTTVNVEENYDNEYAWYSAILSHSENDLMRPIVFNPTVTVPAAPTNFVDALGNGVFSWTDPTPASLATTLANPQNEVGFKILQATLQPDGTLSAYKEVAKVPANKTSWTQPALVAGASYEVVAYNAAGDSAPSIPFSDVVPLAPLGFAITPVTFNTVTLAWANQATTNTLQVWRTVNGGVSSLIATLPGTATSFVDNAANAALFKYTPVVSSQVSYTYEVKAVNALGSATTGALAVTTPMEPVATPTIVSALPNATGSQVTVRWTDNANNETSYVVEWSNGGAFTALPAIPRSAAQKTAIGGAMSINVPTTPGSVYTFRVTAVNTTVNNTMVPANTAVSTSVPATTTVDLTVPVPLAPTALVATLTSATRALVSWTDNATNETLYVVTVTDTSNNAVVFTRNVAANLAGVTGPMSTNVTIVAGKTYTVSVVAQVTKFGITTQSTVTTPLDATAPVAPANVLAVSPSASGTGSVSVTWVDAPKNATGYTVWRARVVAGVVGAFARVNAVQVLPGVQTFTDTGLTVGREYVYQVVANSLVGNATSLPAANVIVK